MRGKRLLAWILSLALLVGTLPGAAFAAQVGPPCENHPEHTGCSYVEESPCGHTEHTADCYTDEFICGFDDAEQIATDSEATEPHEHGPDCHALDCPHERGEHDETCGYVEALPCDHECELCAPQDNGNQDETTSGQNVQKSLEPEPFALDDVCDCTTQCVEQAPNTDCPVCGVDGANLEDCAVRGVLVHLKFYPSGLDGDGVPYRNYGGELLVNVGASGVTVAANSYPATIEVTPTNAEGTATGPAVTYYRAGIVRAGQSQPAASVVITAYPSTGDDTAKSQWMTAWGDGLTVAYVTQEPTPTQQVCNCTVPCTGEAVKQACPVCKEAITVTDVCAVKVLSVSLTLFPGAVSEGNGAVYNDGTSRTVTVGASGTTTFTLDKATYPEIITIDTDITDGPKKGTYQRVGFLQVDELGTAQAVESVAVPAFPSTGDKAKKDAWNEDWGRGLRVAYVRQEPEPEPSEQFPTLEPGETYWFDLSEAGIPTTGSYIQVNDALPDKNFHWVPFTYTGTITAYKVPDINTASDTASNSAYGHSLFIADYNVVNSVTWDELNAQRLIFGKTYSAANVDYTLRAPSAGSNSENGIGIGYGGVPKNNEWDQIPVVFYKNCEAISSWGQDTFARNASYRVIRGYNSARRYNCYSSSSRHPNLGFRPVLEIPSPDTLTSDGLRVVTLNLNGGKIGDVEGLVNMVVAAGETNTFKAPSNVGINLPTDAERFLGWRGNSRNYQPGEDIGFGENTLTAMWEYKHGGSVSPGGDDDDDSSSTGNPISQPGSGTTFPIISGNGTTGSVTIKGGTNASATGMTTEEMDGHIEDLKESDALDKLLQNFSAKQAMTGASGVFPVPRTESIDGIFGANITAQPGTNGMNIQFVATLPLISVEDAVAAAEKITENSSQAEILAALGQLNGVASNYGLLLSDDELNRIYNAVFDICVAANISTGNLSTYPSKRDGTPDLDDFLLDQIPKIMNEIANRGNTGGGITPGKNTGDTYTVKDAYMIAHILKDDSVEGYFGTPSAGIKGTDKNGNSTTTFPLMKVGTGSTAIQTGDSMTITTAPNGTTYKTQFKATSTSPFILCQIQYLALSNPFTDVAGTDWFYPAVMELYSRGIMQGTSATTFSPSGPVTRAQAAQVLYNMDGRPQAAPGGVTSDIPADAWYADAAAWAMGRGIVQVTGDRFGGDDPVSREELVEMLYRYAKYKNWDVSVGENTNILSYKDFDQIGEAAVAAFQWACGAGIMQGDGNGYLHPQDGLTRAELAGMIQRALDKYKQPAAPVSSPNTGERKARRYKVQKGDTLSGLAGRYHTTVAAIVEANPIIKDPSFLLVGWELDIP